MEGVDRALLLSAPAQDQVELQKNFIDAAKRNGVRHVVKFSAASADAKSKRVFAKWHGASEDQLRASGVAWTMLRPTFFMQNLLGLAGMVKGGAINELNLGMKEGLFNQVSDVVRRVGKKEPITLEQFIREHAAAFQ